MLAAVFHGPGEMEVTEVERPEVGPDEVLVRVGANTLCGTDVRVLNGEKTRGIRQPSILGHEISGYVAEAGSGVKGYEVGAPVGMAPMIPCRRCFYCQHGMENVCPSKQGMGYDLDGGMGEYVRIPAAGVETGNLFAAAEDLPPEHISLAEPLSCCINGQRRLRIGLDDTVLVMGAGPIGLLHLQLALLSGARQVIVSEPRPDRRRFAEELGAHLTIDPDDEDLAPAVEEATGGLGVDVAIICIGRPQLVNEAFRLARKGGRVNVFAGLAGAGWAEVEANLIHYDELEVSGASDSRRADYGAALRLIESGRVDVSGMVTHRFPLASVHEALDVVAEGNGVKVALIP